MGPKIVHVTAYPRFKRGKWERVSQLTALVEGPGRPPAL